MLKMTMNYIPDDFPFPCNCLKCARANVCHVMLNNLRVAGSPSVKLLNLVRIHLVILVKQNINDFIKIFIIVVFINVNYFFQCCSFIPPKIIRKCQFFYTFRVGDKEGRLKDMG